MMIVPNAITSEVFGLVCDRVRLNRTTDEYELDGLVDSASQLWTASQEELERTPFVWLRRPDLLLFFATSIPAEVESDAALLMRRLHWKRSCGLDYVMTVYRSVDDGYTCGQVLLLN